MKLTALPSSEGISLPVLSLTSAMTTLAPCATNMRTVAAPNPEAPPLTTALLPWMFIDVYSSFGLFQPRINASDTNSCYLSQSSFVCIRVHSRRNSLLYSLNDRGVGHAAAFAHGLQAVARAGAFELMDQGRHEPRTARS